MIKKFAYSLLTLFVVAMTLTSCENVPAPYGYPEDISEGGISTVELAGDGTKENPYNVAAAITLLKGMEANVNTNPIYVKGKISLIKSVETAQYGNATYYISDDGTTNNQLYIFQSFYLGNVKFTAEDQIKVGDEVIIYGPFVNYQGNTPETVGKGSTYIYSLNGKVEEAGESGSESTAEPSGKGTEAEPYNVAAIQKIVSALPADGTTEELFVKGKIVSITAIDTTNFGNATYYISDDGSDKGKFYIYRSLDLGNKKFTSAYLKVGDEVVVRGIYTNYKGNTPESAPNKSYLHSVNGSTTTPEGGNTGEDTGGTTPPATSDSITISGTTVILTNSAATAGETTVSIDLNTLGLANAADAPVVTLSDGSTITFGQGENTTNFPKFYTATKGIRLYAKNTIDFACKENIAQIVFTCDSYNDTYYVGNTTQTITFNGTKATYINDHTDVKGGVQLRLKTITITYAK